MYELVIIGARGLRCFVVSCFDKLLEEGGHFFILPGKPPYPPLSGLYSNFASFSPLWINGEQNLNPEFKVVVETASNHLKR